MVRDIYAALNGGGSLYICRRAPQYKKHKTWDGDGVLVVNGSSCTLYDTDGKQYVDYSHPICLLRRACISDLRQESLTE